MTAINIVRQADTVHCITDGAHADADGVIRALASKVHLLPTLLAVLAVRGLSPLLTVLATRLQVTAQTFEHMIAALPDLARDVNRELVAGGLYQGCSSHDFEIIVAGWPAQGPAAIYLMPSHGLHAQHGLSDIRPWVMNPFVAGDLLAGPLPDDAAMEAAGWKDGPPDADTFQPVIDGVKLVAAQRASRFDYAGLPAGARIGGFVQLTSVTRDCIITAIVHRWPEDKIGCKIGGERAASTSFPTFPHRIGPRIEPAAVA